LACPGFTKLAKCCHRFTRAATGRYPVPVKSNPRRHTVFSISRHIVLLSTEELVPYLQFLAVKCVCISNRCLLCHVVPLFEPPWFVHPNNIQLLVRIVNILIMPVYPWKEKKSTWYISNANKHARSRDVESILNFRLNDAVCHRFDLQSNAAQMSTVLK
jgi:hypothetical protein